MDNLLDAVASMRRQHILVLGDLILDRYTWGSAERVSPEAPTVVLRVDHVEVRLGGAAAVAGLLRGLGATVTLAGVVGGDGSGILLQKLLDDAGIDSHLVLVDASRPTTVKDRFLGCAPHRTPHQILRVDQESIQPLGDDLTQTMITGLTESLTQSAALLISDYAKGVCRPSLLRQAITAASEHELPVIVDPARGRDYQHYRGATVIKPNRIEAELVTGMRIHQAADAWAAGERIRCDTGCDGVVVTLDRDGMAVVAAQEPPRMFPARVREVTDITGAGDTVLAVLGFALANGIGWEPAARLAIAAAGLQVERLGVAAITLEELRASLMPRAACGGKLTTLTAMVTLASEYRAAGKRIVFTNGCFDLLHAGHVTLLEEAAKRGEVLVVAINADTGVRRLKGPTRPVVGERERAALVAALACVDHVLLFDDDTPLALLEAIRPDVLIKGGDYPVERVVGRDFVASYGGEVCVATLVSGVSTTAIVQRLTGGRASAAPAGESESTLPGAPTCE